MSTPIDPPQSRRAARQAEVTAQDAQPDGAAPPLTRRARGGAPANVAPSTPGDVEYRTQIRPRVPHYDAPPVDHPVIGADGRPIGAPGIGGASGAAAGAPLYVVPPLVEPPVAAPMAPPAAPPAAPPVAPPPSEGGAQVRRRDFRPPTEQFAGQPATPFDPRLAPAGTGGIGADAPLDYHTQLASHVQAPAAQSPTSLPPAVDAPALPPNETTLSRRELRERREQPADGPAFTPLAPEFGDTAGSMTQAGVAHTFFANPASPPPGYSVDPGYAPQPPAFVPPTAPQLSPQPSPNPAPPTGYAPTTVAEPIAQPAPAQVAPVESPSSAATGSHWSVGIHDDEDPFVNTFSREVGSAVSLTNTNALVLPEMPTGGISGPVAGTGEIIITGMIDVPRVVSSTGAVPAVHETAEIDDLFDPGDLTAAPADAAPVSALKAVSSHTSSHSIIATGRRPAGNAITTVLVASTVVMAVVAIGLFVIAAANGLF